MAEVAEQQGKILGALAGTTTVWGLELALRLGILEHLEDKPEGATVEQVASALELDAQYTHVVLRAAYAGEVLERDADGRYRLADHMGVVLLDPDAPGYLGGAVKTFVALREVFLNLRELAHDGGRRWWSDMDPEWIEAVGEHGQTYYRRFLNVVVPQLPAVQETLERGARYLDLASGVCKGPAKIVGAYPQTSVTAVDGDRFTLEVAAREIGQRGIGDKFKLVESMLEDLDIEGGHDLALINISLHEARDIQRVVDRTYAALDEGGTFVVQEFPFPEREEDVRSVPGRLMSGVQFFEAHIGCQLLPASRFVEHLEKAGFKNVGVIDVTPMHVVIHGTK
jgi:SAM-dependent methyltransferase